ncbi:MAG: TRAP transporter small permease [Myxococcota bacterium]|jgi:TRAP-type C4-dicarboxylate transport system permease small subunit|nr:TRAP transporter small permease [Myxococcota bacterium]
MLKYIDRIDDAWATVERALIAVLLLAMLLLAVFQVVLRNGFDTGIEWADVTVRHLVLWVGLLGASIAAKENRHLSVDIASRIIPEKWYHLVDSILSLVTAAVCGLLFWAALLFARFLYQEGTGTMVGLPALLAGGILPLAFIAVALRFALRAIREVAAFKKKPRGEDDPTMVL